MQGLQDPDVPAIAEGPAWVADRTQAPHQGRVGKLKCPNVIVAAASGAESESDPSDQGGEDSFGKQD